MRPGACHCRRRVRISPAECRRGPEKHGAELRLRHVAEHVPADVIEQDDDGFGD